MPRLRARMDADGLLLLSAVLTAAVMGVLSFAPAQWVAVAALLVCGAAWITALTTLNSTAQAILPNWVRGRTLAVYLTVFNGAMTRGSLAWGATASAIGVPFTLAVAAIGLLSVGFAFHAMKLPKGEADLIPSNHWPEPLTSEPVEHDRGPVLVLIEYTIDKADRSEFLKALARLSHERRRDGAYGWGVTEDAADPGRLVEWFMVESWAEHLRQHKRVSKADADIQDDVRRYHKGPAAPVVNHFLAINHPHLG